VSQITDPDDAEFMSITDQASEATWEEQHDKQQQRIAAALRYVTNLTNNIKTARTEIDNAQKKHGLLQVRHSLSGTIHGDMQVAPPYVANTQPDKEDPITLGREFRYQMTNNLISLSHAKICGLLKRYQRTWDKDTAYYHMLQQVIENLERSKFQAGYTREDLIKKCKNLLVPEAYVLCQNNLALSKGDTRLREHAVEDTRQRMHKQMVFDNQAGNKGHYNRNCGELPMNDFRSLFNKVRYTKFGLKFIYKTVKVSLQSGSTLDSASSSFLRTLRFSLQWLF